MTCMCVPVYMCVCVYVTSAWLANMTSDYLSFNNF